MRVPMRVPICVLMLLPMRVSMRVPIRVPMRVRASEETHYSIDPSTNSKFHDIVLFHDLER